MIQFFFHNPLRAEESGSYVVLLIECSAFNHIYIIIYLIVFVLYCLLLVSLTFLVIQPLGCERDINYYHYYYYYYYYYMKPNFVFLHWFFLKRFLTAIFPFLTQILANAVTCGLCNSKCGVMSSHILAKVRAFCTFQYKNV